MEYMNITSAQYEIGERMVRIVYDGGTMSVPVDPANRHYAEIMRQVEAGELTIQEASE